ncbi:MAG: selenium metabolism-associated LysR family transcriptional regulator [Desulfuromonadales bacterium]|nr:selenium metabolism-associated LysR family transcriptional regulator [Desulfuromonadales bacterium]
MNLRQIEVFVAVVEAGSFSRGADAALLTQSTVSQHVAALESEFELRLLDRTGQGVVLTRAGELFLQHARQVLSECASLQQAMAGFRGLHQVCLTIGASNIPANYLIPTILPHLSAEHPGIALTMQTGDSRAMLNRLLADEVELVVVGSRSDDRGIEYLPLTGDLLVLTVSSRHPWSRCTAITLDELAESPIIVRENGSGSDQALQQALRQAGFDPNRLQVAVRLGSNEAVRQALLNGFGAAFLSELSIQQELKRGELVKVPVVGFAVKRQFWIARRCRRTASPAALVFVALMQENFAPQEQ